MSSMKTNEFPITQFRDRADEGEIEMNKFSRKCPAPLHQGTEYCASCGAGTQPEYQPAAPPALAIAAVLAMLAFTAPAFAAPGGGSSWIENGATACEKYLTRDVVSAILTAPAGAPQRLDAHSCHTGMIYITLKVADIDEFRLEVPRIAFAHPIAGVGDGAFLNEAGGFSAVKGHDRGCDISVVGAPVKIHEAALGQKLGDICNKLFALP
jgi:hypothetical protein